VKYGVFQDKWEMLHFFSEVKGNLFSHLPTASVKITAQDHEGGFPLNLFQPCSQ
jgi:hypothetical protein